MTKNDIKVGTYIYNVNRDKTYTFIEKIIEVDKNTDRFIAKTLLVNGYKVDRIPDCYSSIENFKQYCSEVQILLEIYKSLLE